MNAPSELVDFFDWQRMRRVESFDVLNTAAEIADFVKSIPRRHLNRQIAVHVWNIYGDVEKMLRRIGKRELVRNRGVAG